MSELDDLAAAARHHRQLVTKAGRDAAREAMITGEVLLAAKALVDKGRWNEWVATETGISRPSAERYMRLAAYQQDTELWLAAGGSGTLTAALRHLSGLPTYDPRTRTNTALRSHASQLRDEGTPIEAIARALGRAPKTIRTYLDPSIEQRKRGARRLAAQRRRGHLQALRHP